MSFNYHRSRSGREKSVWRKDFSREMEFALFDLADKRDWQDGARGYWGVVEGAHSKLGADGERIAMFPYRANPSDDWHGYPLFLDQKRRPTKALAQAWIDDKVVSLVVGEKIKRGKL